MQRFSGYFYIQFIDSIRARLSNRYVLQAMQSYSLFISNLETNLIKPIHAESLMGCKDGVACDFN